MSDDHEWTTGANGNANSSEMYRYLVRVITALIRADAHRLISGHTEWTAGLILSQLAHVYGLAPTEMTAAVMRDQEKSADGN